MGWELQGTQGRGWFGHGTSNNRQSQTDIRRPGAGTARRSGVRKDGAVGGLTIKERFGFPRSLEQKPSNLSRKGFPGAVQI